jgi:hypothetical protein
MTTEMRWMEDVESPTQFSRPRQHDTSLPQSLFIFNVSASKFIVVILILGVCILLRM